jgi:hypothetical protein
MKCKFRGSEQQQRGKGKTVADNEIAVNLERDSVDEPFTLSIHLYHDHETSVAGCLMLLCFCSPAQV